MGCSIVAHRIRRMGWGRFGLGLVVGYFGRIEDETLPRHYLGILPRLEEEIPKVSMVFAGSEKVLLRFQGEGELH